RLRAAPGPCRRCGACHHRHRPCMKWSCGIEEECKRSTREPRPAAELYRREVWSGAMRPAAGPELLLLGPAWSVSRLRGGGGVPVCVETPAELFAQLLDVVGGLLLVLPADLLGSPCEQQFGVLVHRPLPSAHQPGGRR